jgi:hypothetical protein
VTENESTPTPVNATSKKRSKARKQSGLQAMLAKKKEESKNSGALRDFGFKDLMKAP